MPRAASSPFSCASAVFPASTSAFRISLSFLLLKKNVAASDCTCSDVVVFLSAIQTQQSLNLPRGLAYFCTRFLPKE